MKSEPLVRSVRAKKAALGRVLTKSENIKEAVAQAAGELVSVNEALQQKTKGNGPTQAVNDAIAQNLDVEAKVAKAADDLKRANFQLATQVAAQASLTSELAETKTTLAQVRDDLSESQDQERDARQKALHDSLTGIPNRASFDQALDHGLIQARRHGWKLAVLFIDIDEFKSINDAHGHDMGDQVLVTVANRLQSSLREEERVLSLGRRRVRVPAARSPTGRRLGAPCGEVAQPDCRGLRVKGNRSFGQGQHRNGPLPSRRRNRRDPL